MSGKRARRERRAEWHTMQIERWLERADAAGRALPPGARLTRAQACEWTLAQIASARADGDLDADTAASLARAARVMWREDDQ